MEATVLVLERDAYWSSSLKWEFQNEAWTVRASDRLKHWPEVFDRGGTPLLLVWDGVTDQPAMLDWLLKCAREGRSPRLIVCATPAESALEETLRGLGVVSWSSEFRSPAEVAHLCRKLLRSN